MKLHIAPLAAAGLLALASLNAWSLSSLVGEMLDGNGQGAEKLEWRPQLSASADARNLQSPNKDYPLSSGPPDFLQESRAVRPSAARARTAPQGGPTGAFPTGRSRLGLGRRDDRRPSPEGLPAYEIELRGIVGERRRQLHGVGRRVDRWLERESPAAGSNDRATALSARSSRQLDCDGGRAEGSNNKSGAAGGQSSTADTVATAVGAPVKHPWRRLL